MEPLKTVRHDKVNLYLELKLRDMGWDTLLEQRIPTEEGTRPSNLVIWRGNRALVLDTSVTEDARVAYLEDVKSRMVAYYKKMRSMLGYGSVLLWLTPV